MTIRRAKTTAKLPLVLSSTALVVAVLGTTPLAAVAQNVVFPRNSVGTTQLKRDAVTAAKVAPGAIRSVHVQNGSLLAADFKLGQLPQGPKGDRGDKGDKGDKGDRGDKGDPGGTTVVVRRSEFTTGSGGGVSPLEVACEPGERAVGGGMGLASGGYSSNVQFHNGHPVPNTSGSTPTAWRGYVVWTETRTVAISVICVRP